MENREQNEMIKCPYDCHHRLLKSRLPLHLLRCGKNHQDVEMFVCPYDTSHVLKQEELNTHFMECKAGAKHRMRKLVEPISPAPPRPLLEGTEDWDKEPPTETYDPEDYCKKNLIIRAVHGEPRAARRKFRESERLRLQELAKIRDEQ